MKQFINKILLLFITPIILLSYPIDLLISNIIKNKEFCLGENEVWNDILDGKIDANIAIYGSSRAWVHFNPLLFEKKLHKKTYNFGIDGHSFWLQYLRHKEYFKYNTKPKLIIYSLDVYTLAKRENLYNQQQFLPYMLWKTDFYNFTKSYNGFNSLDYIIPLKRYFGNINALNLIEPTKKIRYKGFKSTDKKWNNDLEKAKMSNPNYRVAIDRNSVILFKQFINDMKKENIDLIFVYPPEFIEGHAFVKNRSEIISIFNEISKENNIPFFNYSYNDISYNKSLFYNASHLNKEGADIFTNVFITDYKEYQEKKSIP